MEVTVLNNQSVFDIAIQYCGSALASFEIAKLNQLQVTAELKPGQTLNIPNWKEGKDVANYFENRKHQPATAWDLESSVIQPQPEGISYWAIGIDFKITAAE
jgi:hypothetical protein